MILKRLILCIMVSICPLICLEARMDKEEIQVFEKALAVLKDISQTGSSEAKAEAARVWSVAGAGLSKPILLEMLKNPNHDVMASAARALHDIGDPAGKAHLEEVIQEEFQVSDDAGSIEKFKLYSRFKFRKLSAAEELGKIGDKVSYRLISWLKDQSTDGIIRDACSIGLAIMGDPAERIVFENAVSIGNNDDRAIRKAAVKALGKIASTASLEVLRKSLYDPEADVRAEAVVALGKIGSSSIASDVRARVDDDDRNVRREVMRTLGLLNDPDSVPVLTKALKSNDGVLRLIAAGSLGRYGYAKGLSDIETAMNNKDRDTRLVAVEALARIENKKVLGWLETLLRDTDDLVRMKAAGAIIRKFK